MPKKHVPQVTSQHDGKWGVFCAACSHEAGDYVYPCRLATPHSDWPPPNLYELVPSAEPHHEEPTVTPPPKRCVYTWHKRFDRDDCPICNLDDLSAMAESVVMNPEAIGTLDMTPHLFVGADLRSVLRPCACGGVNGFHKETCSAKGSSDGV